MVATTTTKPAKDRQFCGGTHLANTAEIVRLKIAGTRSKGKLNKRIEIVLE